MQRYGVGLLVVALLVGCTRAGDDRPAPALREAWRLHSFTPIGQPVAVGDTVVAYGTDERDLLLFGISVADGTIRWRQAASPSIVASGIPVTPDVIGGRVAYFRPDRFANLGARLVVATPDTGADLLVSEPLHFTSYPGSCADGKDVCVRVVQGDRSVSRRFSVDARGAVADAVLLRPIPVSAPTSSSSVSASPRSWPASRAAPSDGGHRSPSTSPPVTPLTRAGISSSTAPPASTSARSAAGPTEMRPRAGST